MGQSTFLEKLGDMLGAGLSTPRRLNGGWLWLLRVLGFVFAVYFLFGAVNGSFTVIGPRSWGLLQIDFPYLPYYGEQFMLPLFIFFTSVLTFLLYPARASSPQDHPSIVDIIFCLISLAIVIEFIWQYDPRGDRAGLVE
ncbi:MAG: hypothetical protein O2807_13385, partial [bacterium]|nr:hypothetical protein [bacterium]